MSTPTPTPVNPFRAALVTLAGVLLAGGAIAYGLSLPEGYDDGSATGRTLGVLMMGAGGAFLMAWLVVAALTWQPDARRPGLGSQIAERIERL
ncbi:hypothetical protein [Jiangella gansuensis]|uniref:hypothetical protein n=1 Tax=Jiangella gansuensis TaxID=281473 RepID=UPI0004BBF6DC|nr:hypothetical protein [Jiangella gansuensis]